MIHDADADLQHRLDAAYDALRHAPTPDDEAWADAQAIAKARVSRTFTVEPGEAPAVLAAMGYTTIRNIDGPVCTIWED